MYAKKYKWDPLYFFDGKADEMKRKQLIHYWKSWMNRNRSFSKPEMEELESHLWVEMDELVASEGCTEEEAFHQVVAKVGSKQVLSTEYKKINKFSFSRINSWIHEHPYQILIGFLLIIAVLVGDYVYVVKYSLIKNDIINSGVMLYTNLQENPPERVYISLRDPSTKKTQYQNEDSEEQLFIGKRTVGIGNWLNKDNYRITINNLNDLISSNGEYILINFDDCTYCVSFETGTNPLYFGVINYNEDQFYIIIDNQNSCWISESNIFTKDTYHLRLQPRNYTLHLYEFADPNAITNDKTSYFLSLYDEDYHTVMYEQSAKFHNLKEKDQKKLSKFYNKAGGIFNSKEPFFNTSNDYHILQLGKPDNPYFFKFEIMKYSYKNTTNYSFPFMGKEFSVNSSIDEKSDFYNFHWVIYAGDREIKHFFPTFINYLKKLFNNILLDDIFFQ